MVHQWLIFFHFAPSRRSIPKDAKEEHHLRRRRQVRTYAPQRAYCCPPSSLMPMFLAHQRCGSHAVLRMPRGRQAPFQPPGCERDNDLAACPAPFCLSRAIENLISVGGSRPSDKLKQLLHARSEEGGFRGHDIDTARCGSRRAVDARRRWRGHP